MVDISQALSFHSKGDLEKAKALYHLFLAENAKHPDVSNLLGLIYLQENDLKNAQKYFEDAVEGFPCAEFYQNLGLCFYKQKKYKDAMFSFDKAIDFEADNVEFVRNFAKMAKQSEQYDFAKKFYERVVEINSDDYVAWNNLGLVYEQFQELNSAKLAYEQSIRIKDNYEGFHNLGVLYRTLRDFDSSILYLRKALELQPESQETQVSLGMSYLSKKDLKNGYKYYRYMPKEKRAEYKNYWEGGQYKDKTLFLDYYAGYGDHIMFSRYFPLLKDCFKDIKAYVPLSERVLFKENFNCVDFVSNKEVEYDYSANIMDLQNLLNIEFDKIPFSAGYLNANKDLVEIYRKKYFEDNGKFKIGLFWQGNPKVFKNRSIKLREFERLFELNNVEFYGLVKDDVEPQIVSYPFIKDLGSTFKNFSDTAAALKNLDLMITIDSSVVHLAGALGVKTFLLLPYSSEWRWFDDVEKTPWYDSVKLFKQEKPYDWAPVVDKVFEELNRNLNKLLDS